MDTITQLVLLSLAAGTPLVFAALGELVVEKSGVLNLGVEGMMLVGAIASFIVAAHTHSPWLGVAAGAFAAAALSVIFAVVALTLRANQVATGLALSLSASGCQRSSAATIRASSSKGSRRFRYRRCPGFPWSAVCCSGTTRSSICRLRYLAASSGSSITRARDSCCAP